MIHLKAFKEFYNSNSLVSSKESSLFGLLLIRNSSMSNNLEPLTKTVISFSLGLSLSLTCHTTVLTSSVAFALTCIFYKCLQHFLLRKSKNTTPTEVTS